MLFVGVLFIVYSVREEHLGIFQTDKKILSVIDFGQKPYQLF